MDQAVFGVFVDAGPTVTLDEVLAAVKSGGITMANFVGVGPQQFIDPGGASRQQLEWTFGLAAPLSKIKDMMTSLAALQKSVADKKTGMTLSYSLASTQVSPQLQQSQTCSAADLLADARTQAQKLANAAGGNLGQILAMSSPTSSTTSAGSLAAGTSIGRFTTTYPLTTAAPCSLTVKFAFSRY